MDLAITYTNALAAMKIVPVRIPFHFDTDAECLQAAFRLAGVVPERARVLRIHDTLALGEMIVSTTYLDEIQGRDDLEVVGTPEPWSFGGVPGH